MDYTPLKSKFQNGRSREAIGAEILEENNSKRLLAKNLTLTNNSAAYQCLHSSS